MTGGTPRPSRILWLDPRFGASGDMVLGALVGLGAPLDEIVAGLDDLAVDGWSVTAEEVRRCSLASTRVTVAAETLEHHRSWSSIDRLLAGADLPAHVVAGSRATFRRLGEVEAAIHRVTIEEVHFHEVGAVDAIIDIVGAWLALHRLEVGEVVVGPVGLGHGTVRAAHGELPIPAPATADLLTGADVVPVDVAAETVTPTGAALLTTMADRFGPLPAGRLVANARGAGGRDPDGYPNVLSGFLLDSADPGAATTPAAAGTAVATATITTNLDDVTPEVVAHVIDRCLAAGADDAWATPIVMKKGRPAVALEVMCDPARTMALTELVMRETGTLGVRVGTTTKHVLPRLITTVTVRGHEVRIKVGPHGAKPEHDDLVTAGAALDLPIRDLAREALAAHAATNQLANDPASDQTATP
ncbi:MAG: nickel pincer cofactor biosynthesis protein LarC [Actinomycetota bacterium]